MACAQLDSNFLEGEAASPRTLYICGTTDVHLRQNLHNGTTHWRHCTGDTFEAESTVAIRTHTSFEVRDYIPEI